MADLNQFEAAIRCVFTLCQSNIAGILANFSTHTLKFLHEDPASMEMKRQAEQYCAAVKKSDEGWKYCLQLFFSSSSKEARFYCLQVNSFTLRILLFTLSQSLEDMLRGRIPLAPASACDMRNALLGWIAENGAAISSLPVFIENKLSLVVALFVKYQYFNVWQTAFHDLLKFVSMVSHLISNQFGWVVTPS